jgi:CotH kinase protein/Lamin Tail Domain/Secretion system C-terminal sorting domain
MLKTTITRRVICGLALGALVFIGYSAGAQSLPPEMRISTDGHRLVSGGVSPTSGLYDSTQVKSIYLDFQQTNYWTLLQQNYATRTPIAANLTYDGVTYNNIGVHFKGNTSYMNVQNSQKKSFGVDMEFTTNGEDLMGYKTLNFNNAFEDASFLREVFYLHQIRKHIPAAKANFIHLYLNNVDWGLYPNVQQVNKDLLDEWFLSNNGANWRATTDGGTGPGPGGPGGQWGDGTAALNYLGADTASYQEYYTLKSSDMTNPWDKLVAGCNALNNTTTGNLPTVLPAFFDVDRVLWHLASEIAFSDDDSYVYKGKMDYYVYYEPETGRLAPLEFDGNSAMKANSATWSPFYNANKVNYPLLNKILAVPQWRQRYLAHMRTIINEELNPANCNAILDNYKTQIDALVNADPKKLYTYTQFNTEITVLKNFVASRRTSLLANAEVAQVAPTIGTVTYYNNANQAWTAPLANEAVNVTAAVTSTNGISGVNLYYATDLVGNFTKASMFDDGAHNDGAAGDGTYGASLPGQIAGTWVRFYVEAVAGNQQLSVSYSPVGAEHDVYVYTVQTTGSATTGVVINELMASNSTTHADEAGEFEDWIELYNNNDFEVDLSGFYLTDNPANLDKWELAQGTLIPANGYLIFWADEDSAQGPTNHTNFKLSAAGEVVYLLDASLGMVDSITFGLQTEDMGFARIPNGTGPFIIKDPTFNDDNQKVLGLNTTTTQNIGIFPNPANAFFKVTGLNSNQPQKVEVTNSMGQVVYTETATGQAVVYTGGWANGMYLVRCGTTVKKVIVNN